MSHPLITSRTQVARIRHYFYPDEDMPYATFIYIKVDNLNMKVFSGIGTTPLEAKDSCYEKALEFIEDLFNEV